MSEERGSLVTKRGIFGSLLGNAMGILMHIFGKYARPDGENETMTKKELADFLREGNF